MSALLPLRFEDVTRAEMLAATVDPDKVYRVPTHTKTVYEASDGLAPSGGPSLTMGAWGCRRQDVPNRGNGYHASEWMLVTAGSVTITDGQGKATTHKQGDIFVVPKGLCFAWDQSDDFTKHYVIGDHAAPDAAPTEVICYDRAQPCTGDAEYWFFCTGPEDLAPGSAVPVAASHDYHTSSCGQFSAGLWTCTAHETVVGSYPVHEFIHLLEGSIILTVDDQEHVFEAGDSFFIPQGLECSWRQPAALKKCYIVYTPTAAAPDAKL